MHEGSLLGRINQILSTVLAFVFMLISGAGAVMWWKRRPQGRLDTPRLILTPILPFLLKGALVIIGLLLPLAGLSFLLIMLSNLRRKSSHLSQA